jgi:hypothetical protein
MTQNTPRKSRLVQREVPSYVQSCTLIVSLMSTGEASAVLAVMDATTRRHAFTRLALGDASTADRKGLLYALQAASWEAGIDPESPLR